MGLFLLLLRGVETILLYSFLLAVIYILWQFYSSNAAFQNPFAQKPELVLRTEDPSEVGFSSAEFPTLDVLLVGRGEHNHFTLHSSAVSADHGKISYEHGQWWVEDNHSRNGTYLNETKLISKTAILDGDILRFGDQILRTNIIQRRITWKK